MVILSSLHLIGVYAILLHINPFVTIVINNTEIYNNNPYDTLYTVIVVVKREGYEEMNDWMKKKMIHEKRICLHNENNHYFQ